MNTKAEFQKQIDDLQGQTKSYQARRAELISERNQLSASIDAQTQQIGSALIQGQDTVRASEAVARDREKFYGINSAIEQLDAWLPELERRRVQASMNLAAVDFDRIVGEADVLFLDAVAGYRAAFEKLTALDAKLGELAGLGMSAGKSADSDDHTRLMWGLCRNLHFAIQQKMGMLDDQVCTRVTAEARFNKAA